MKNLNKKLLGILMVLLLLNNLINIPAYASGSNVSIVAKVGSNQVTSLNLGQVFEVSVLISNVNNLSVAGFAIKFNPEVIKVVDNATGSSVTSDGTISSGDDGKKGLTKSRDNWANNASWVLDPSVDNTSGLIKYSMNYIPDYKINITTAECLFSVNFKAIGTGDPGIHFATSADSKYDATIPNGHYIGVVNADGLGKEADCTYTLPSLVINNPDNTNTTIPDTSTTSTAQKPEPAKDQAPASPVTPSLGNSSGETPATNQTQTPAPSSVPSLSPTVIPSSNLKDGDGSKDTLYKRTPVQKIEPIISITPAPILIQSGAIIQEGTIKTELKINGSSAKAIISKATIQEITNKAENVVNLTKKLDQQLQSTNAYSKLDTIITIKTPEKPGVNTVNAEIPQDLINALNAKGIDRINLAVGIGSVSISTEDMNIKGSTAVNILLKKMNNNELLPQQKLIVRNNPVFDFNLTSSDKAGKVSKINNFKNLVEIVVPYISAKGQDMEKITAFFINDKGIIENMAGSFNPVSKTFTFKTEHFSKYFITENKVAYSDLKDYEKYKKYIEVLAAKGIFQSDKANRFLPGKNITKGELALLLMKAFKLYSIDDKNISKKLKDVSLTNQYYKPIIAVIKAGLMEIDKNNCFKASENISREDISIIFAKAAKQYRGFYITGDLKKYLDFIDKADIKTSSCDSIALLNKYKILEVKSGKYFKPSDFVNRAEISKILYTLLYQNAYSY